MERKEEEVVVTTVTNHLLFQFNIYDVRVFECVMLFSVRLLLLCMSFWYTWHNPRGAIIH